jgi:DMSO/TMAO reductase YedYZ heme-binding membrane subunit
MQNIRKGLIVMEQKKALMLAGVVVALAIAVITVLIRDTYYIWLETRIFGLLAYGFLWLLVLSGELKLLGRPRLFKVHVPLAVASMLLVLAHFLSAVLDNFKWGLQLVFTQYLGFSFSDKWLIYLSLGTLAFYLMAAVAFSSARKSIHWLTFKRWKIVHVLSYVSLILVYLHSINLGTDVQHSMLAPYLTPLLTASFIVVAALLLTRAVRLFHQFSDGFEVGLATLFFLVLITGSVFIYVAFAERDAGIERIQDTVIDTQTQMRQYESEITDLNAEKAALQQSLGSLLIKLNLTVNGGDQIDR